MEENFYRSKFRPTPPCGHPSLEGMELTYL